MVNFGIPKLAIFSGYDFYRLKVNFTSSGKKGLNLSGFDGQ